MKRYILLPLLALAAGASAQKSESKASFELGKGLDISLNNGDYRFNLGGFIEANGAFYNVKDGEAEYRFGVKHAMLGFTGAAFDEKVSFKVQLDFTDSYPLLDAWVAYHPVKNMSITVGQRPSLTNNREMLMMEQGIALSDRSILSREFTSTGREFGLFVEQRFGIGGVGFNVGASVTSGDGRNSFGSSSLDVDNGGFKYGGRVDVYPFGFFTAGNELVGADFIREESPKLVVGGAFSYNNGVSNRVGDGHGDFILYDKDGKNLFPDYRKIAADLLFKYKGISFLAEYLNTSATKLNGIYTKATPDSKLLPAEIASYLALGNGYNFQLGYCLKNGIAFDVRYSKVLPEFGETAKSALYQTEAYGAGVSKYFVDNRLKLQGLVSYFKSPNKLAASESLLAEISVHVVF